MAPSIPTTLHLRSLPPPLPHIRMPPRNSCSLLMPLRREFRLLIRSCDKNGEDRARVEAEGGGLDLRAAISSASSTSPLLWTRRSVREKYLVGFCVVFLGIVVVTVRQFIAARRSRERQGSVAELVRRGQLRSDRRGISKPLRYDDPFNNPFIKGKSESTVEMFGKVYHLAPVTLTKEQQSIHQKRRSQVYQWKRPTVFLKEGDDIPPDVEPDAIRWIPANHPFATTVSDIDENVARENVYLKHGAPFRIRAEHEALQRKLEALQRRQNPNNTENDLNNSSVITHENQEDSLSTNRHHDNVNLEPDQDMGSASDTKFTDELKKI